MKIKLFTFLGLLIATIGLSIAFGATPVQAKGEKYKWIDKNTIEAGSGDVGNLNSSEDGKIRFLRDQGFEFVSGGGCKIVLTIKNIAANNKNAKLDVDGCDGEESFDRNIVIGNTEKGPPLEGSDLKYTKDLNCEEVYSGGHPSQRGKNIDRCEAVKKCVVTENKSEFKCLQAWATCLMENDDDTTKCGESVGGGNVDEGTDEGEVTEDKTTCAVDGIGWIVCPVVTFLAGIVDGAYDYVLSTLLAVQPLVTTGETKEVYQAWSIMRNFANIAFVIAFMVIIFSQVTSVGITNYGIKKLLPRLIISAILVNISYWICAAAVDISNILGTSIKDVFDSIGGSLSLPAGLSGVSTGDQSGWTGMATIILAGTAVAVLSVLSIFLPILVTVLFAIITVFLVLALRQALIILLVVIAPLAFVAYLLPNTEGLFTKWRKLLQTLLLMYPIIATIFGASALASKIVTSTADGLDEGLQKIVIQIMGAGIAIIPLFITPIVMKTAGTLLNAVGGKINQPREGLRGKARDYSKYRRNIASARRLDGTNMFSAAGARIKARGGRMSKIVGGSLEKTGSAGQKLGVNAATGYMEQRGLTRDQRRANTEKALTEAKQGYIATEASGNAKYAQKLAGPVGDAGKVQASAKAAQMKELVEKIGEEKATMSQSNAGDLKSIMQDSSSSEARRAAAAGQLMKVGADKDIHEALDYVGAPAQATDPSMTSIQQQIANDMGSRKPLSLGASDISNLVKGDYSGDFNSKIDSRLKAGKISANDLASAKGEELDKIENYLRTNSAALKSDPDHAEALNALNRDILEFRTNPQMAGKQPAHEITSRIDKISGLL